MLGRTRFLSLALAGATAALLVPGTAGTVTLGGEAMTSWSDCECDAGSLTYTDDQISIWLSEMKSLGHQQKFYWKNKTTFSSDLIEDNLEGGDDRRWGDDVDFFALSSHGNAPTDSGGRQTYTTPFCHSGGADSCKFDANLSRMGEAAGAGQSQYASPYPGKARWWLFLTCYSVHDKPAQQWSQTLARGGDAILGYRGTSVDAWTTSEVPGDLADAVWDDGDTLKGGWFWAAEDWAHNDTAGIIASGVDEANAIHRRDNLKASSARRTSASNHKIFAWSWHEG